MSEQPIGHLALVNVGRPRQVCWHDRTVATSIWKQSISGRVNAAGVNLDGDDQSDRRVHRGPTKSIYEYAVDDYQRWASELDAPLAPGTFGENLTVAEVDLTAAVVGERWRIGTTSCV